MIIPKRAKVNTAFCVQERKKQKNCKNHKKYKHNYTTTRQNLPFSSRAGYFKYFNIAKSRYKYACMLKHSDKKAVVCKAMHVKTIRNRRKKHIKFT